ncbi:MAG: HAD-IB family phosphatase [Candidatus Peribacter sp.]|nr:HAD-IB family phosphatase [Candidatus Peribacter sp.]
MNNLSKERGNRVVLCDFDGTIAKQDVCDDIMGQFSCNDWRANGALFDRGFISQKQLHELFVSSLRVKPNALREFIRDRIELRNGFPLFFQTCREADITPVIVSSGWDIYIRELLREYPVRFPESLEQILSHNRNQIAAVCNRLEFLEDDRWQLVSQWKETSRLSHPSKIHIAAWLKTKGVTEIAMVGDGSSDYELAHFADLVFARSSLSRHCAENGIPYIFYNTFREISSVLKAA